MVAGTAVENQDWSPCADCSGVRVQGEHCLAHLTEAEWNAELERLGRGEALDARGVSLDGSRLFALLEALKDPESERTRLHGADLSHATLAGEPFFAAVDFSSKAYFDETMFSDGIDFVDVTFEDGASFAGATCQGFFQISRSSFGGELYFVSTAFTAGISIYETFFAPSLIEDREILVTIDGRLWLSAAQCHGDVSISHASFTQILLDSTVFEGQVRLGPTKVDYKVEVADCRFEDDVELDLATPRMSCSRTHFRGRAGIDITCPELVIESSVFYGGARVRGAGPYVEWPDDPTIFARDSWPADVEVTMGGSVFVLTRPARLLSLKRSSVEDLSLANLDLRACRFADAYGLEKLRLEADCDFAPPPAWRWHTPRRTLAEEHASRALGRGSERSPPRWLRRLLARDGPVSWNPPETRGPREGVLQPAQIALLYRALRRALEDRKDEPGAGDFYYGEMEMRRQRQRDGLVVISALGERGVVTLYWLAAGYGLRASRALLSLALTVLAGAFVLDRYGFVEERPFSRSLMFALESSVSLLRAPDVKLTSLGELVQITLKLLGPLFFGLALLSFRGRIKR
jgi:hypothetical protein